VEVLLLGGGLEGEAGELPHERALVDLEQELGVVNEGTPYLGLD